jgi:hypothetical protein
MSASSFEHRVETPRWWLLEPGQNPIGPINGELLLEWFRAGLVHPEALICEVGQQAWRAVGDPTELVTSTARRRSRFDPTKERCLLDIEPVPLEEVPPPSGEHLASSARPHRESGPPPDQPEPDQPTEVTRVAVPKPLRVASMGKSKN